MFGSVPLTRRHRSRPPHTPISHLILILILFSRLTLLSLELTNRTKHIAPCLLFPRSSSKWPGTPSWRVRHRPHRLPLPLVPLMSLPSLTPPSRAAYWSRRRQWLHHRPYLAKQLVHRESCTVRGPNASLTYIRQTMSPPPGNPPKEVFGPVRLIAFGNQTLLMMPGLDNSVRIDGLRVPPHRPGL